MVSLATNISEAAVHHGAASQRGEIYGILVRLLTYPDARLQQSIITGELNHAIRRLLSAMPYSLLCAQAFKGEYEDAAGTIESEFMRLFELPVDGKPCALYGGMYEGNRHTVMEELLRYYRHFGLSVAHAPDKDLPDSIPTVLEFMQFLCLLESRAACLEDAYTPRMAQRDILARHLGRWSPRLCEQIKPLNPLPVYDNAVALMDEFCTAELAKLNA